MTQAQLASEISLDRSALAKIENGSRRVSALELSQIADALGERIEWFLYETPPAIVSHRNLQDPGAASVSIDRLIERLARNVEFIQENDSAWSLPALPQIDRPANPAEAEAAASKARTALGLDRTEPLYNAAETVSRLGLLVFSVDIGAETADAASILLERGAVALINGNIQIGRRRLAFAHELGHCLFADEYSVDWRVAEYDDSSAWESRIDRFARALLLPRGGMDQAWRQFQERNEDLRTRAVKLASRYRVDMSTLARRLVELGHIDRTQADRVRQVRTTRADIVDLNLVTHDELAAPSTPRPYDEAVLRLFRAEMISSARAIDLLLDTWSEDDLPALAPLPENAIWQFVS